MFEYGAPLVWAWIVEHPRHREAFVEASAGFSELTSWILNATDTTCRVTANLCGLVPLGARFWHLYTSYQPILHMMGSTSPLRQLLDGAVSSSPPSSFAWMLGHDDSYTRFRTTSNLEPTLWQALARWLRGRLRRTIMDESAQAHLTRIIPMASRRVLGLLLADVSLLAPIEAQRLLLQYRRGRFMFGYTYACGATFVRGYEVCPALGLPVCLTRREKEEMRIWVDTFPVGSKVTRLDFLLSVGQVARVASFLRYIQEQLRTEYKRILIGI